MQPKLNQHSISSILKINGHADGLQSWQFSLFKLISPHIFFFLSLLSDLNVFFYFCLFVFCWATVCGHTARGNTYVSTDVNSINKATSKQNQETWVKFRIKQAVLKCSAHCTSISTAHKSNLSVLSEGPGAPLFLLLGPIGLPGMLPTLSPAFVLNTSCATHHFPDDLREGGKVMSNGTGLDPHGGRREEKRLGKMRRWWWGGHGHYFSGDYVSIFICVLLLCYSLNRDVSGLITLHRWDAWWNITDLLLWFADDNRWMRLVIQTNIQIGQSNTIGQLSYTSSKWHAKNISL